MKRKELELSVANYELCRLQIETMTVQVQNVIMILILHMKYKTLDCIIPDYN